MSVENSPLEVQNPAYRPIQWVLKQTYADVVERCIVEFTVSGQTVTLPAIPYDPDLSSGNDYYFKIDAQALAQILTAPRINSATANIFRYFNLPFHAIMADSTATISFSATYLYRNPTTNRLTPLGVTDVSPSDVIAINSTPQHAAPMNYDKYLPLFNDTSQLWLSQYPATQNIGRNQNAFLTFLSPLNIVGAPDKIRVTAYNAAGGVIAGSPATINIVQDALQEPQTIAVGTANLLTQTWDSGTINFASLLIAYYTVELISSSFPVPYLQIHRFDIVEPCRQYIRLHWLGLLGGAEVYTFDGLYSKSLTTQNTYAQKPLEWAVDAPQHVITDKGRFKVASNGVEGWTVSSENIDSETADFLKGLLLSAEVYMETADGFLPVTIENTSQELENSRGLGLVNFEIEIKASNGIISQNN